VDEIRLLLVREATEADETLRRRQRLVARDAEIDHRCTKPFDLGSYVGAGAHGIRRDGQAADDMIKASERRDHPSQMLTFSPDLEVGDDMKDLHRAMTP
jgi:hypothetical protein